jgi:hypothetical protein
MKKSAVLNPIDRRMTTDWIHSPGMTGTIRIILTHPKTSVMAMLARKSTPITKSSRRSLITPRTKPNPLVKPKTSFSTRRTVAKSWLAKISRTAVPRIPDKLRRRMIWARISCSSCL